MAGQDSPKKKNKKSSKQVDSLKYLMGPYSNKGVVIRGSFGPRKEKENKNERNKGKVTIVACRKKQAKGKGHALDHVREEGNVTPSN